MALYCITLARLQDAPISRTFRHSQRAAALVWLQMGTDSDALAAQAYAEKEGWTLFLYPTTEPDPLARAKQAVWDKAKESLATR